MAWESSDRREHLPPDWNKIRAQVLKRDGGRCTWRLPRSGKRCPRPATDVDHMGGRDDHRLHMLRSLCNHHHKQVTAKQAWAAKQKRKGREKRVERHPGLK